MEEMDLAKTLLDKHAKAFEITFNKVLALPFVGLTLAMYAYILRLLFDSSHVM